MDASATNCPICVSRDLITYMTGIFDSEATRVIECKACGLQFLDPMMTEEEEAEYYRNYYENQKSRHYAALSIKDIQNRALAHYVQYADVYGPLVDGAEKILEIGCGSGGFIRFVKERAPTKLMTVVERSESNLRFLRDAFQSEYDNLVVLENVDEVAQDDFDLVAAFGVLEHVKNSVAFLNSHRALVRAGGRMVYNVPHPNNPLVTDYGLEEFRKFIYMKQHYYTFSDFLKPG